MTAGSNFVFKSYLKTTAGCLAFFSGALVAGLTCLYWLPNIAGIVAGIFCLLIAFSAAIPLLAGVIVLARFRGAQRGERDLFLKLNASREPAAIRTGALRSNSSIRRRLARKLLGHDLLVGDLVEVKSWEEIRATLDDRGCVQELPFMPEMLKMCGRRAYVFRCMHRLFDYRKSRKMRHLHDGVLLAETMCDGSGHGGCNAACHTIWKSAWLRRIEPAQNLTSIDSSHDATQTGVLQFGTHAPRYSCQLTQLHDASRPLKKWNAAQFLSPVISGNVAPAAFVVGWLTHVFNELQQYRGGMDFPALDAEGQAIAATEETPLRPGDQVIVKSAAEIRATLSDRLIHRGLGFETDMLKHCGNRLCVQSEIKDLIDIVTGEMRTMKTPAYLLKDIHFSGERQLFNAQYEPLFWRSSWLRRQNPN